MIAAFLTSPNAHAHADPRANPHFFISLLEEQADEAAYYLYDSLNETVTLEVSNPVAAKRLSIVFDNPTFELR